MFDVDSHFLVFWVFEHKSKSCPQLFLTRLTQPSKIRHNVDEAVIFRGHYNSVSLVIIVAKTYINLISSASQQRRHITFSQAYREKSGQGLLHSTK